MPSDSTLRLRVRPTLLALDSRVLPSFTPLTAFTNGTTRPAVAASADFNRDGKDDLAVFNGSTGSGVAAAISILLSRGDGQFTLTATLDDSVTSSPTGLITADFNGDGIPDLAAASAPVASTLLVFLGNGDGTFAESFSESRSTFGVGAGDFNGDGKQDLVVLQTQISGPNVYRILAGNGSGQFTQVGLPVVAAFDNSRILTGDLNGDGRIDFVSLSGTGNIEAYLGTGDGTFGAAITTAAVSAGDFTLADFNGDGRLDVVTAESDFTAGTEVLALHANVGGGAFNPAGVQFYTQNSGGLRVASTDFNSDGIPDVVTNSVFNEAAVLYGNGNGTFIQDAKNRYAYTNSGSDLITGDFDGDRNPDFATVGFGSPNSGKVFLNDLPDSTITTLTVDPQQSIVGMPVTLTAQVAPRFQGHDTPTGTVTFLAGETVLGTATLINGVATITVSTLPAGVYSIVAAYSGSPAVVLGTGDVAPRGAALLASRSSPARLVVRNPEFVVGSDNGPVVNFRDGTGRDVKDSDNFPNNFPDSLPASFGESSPRLSPGVRPALGDFNGDGVSDVIGGSGPGIVAQVTIVDGVTLRPIFTVQPFDGFRGGVFVAAADFNGDGIADFAVGADEGAEPRVAVYLSSGGTFVQAASFNAFASAFRGGVRLAAGDIDGDGTPDLIVGAGPGAGPAVAVFDGKNLVTGVDRRLIEDFYAYAEAFHGGVFVAAGDVNRDGFADIVTGAGLGAPHVTAVSGLSLVTGGQQTLASFYAADRTNLGGIRVAAQHLDADGYCDIVAGAGVGNGSTVWGFSSLSLISTPTDRPASVFEENVFPGLYAGVYVG